MVKPTRMRDDNDLTAGPSASGAGDPSRADPGAAAAEALPYLAADALPVLISYVDAEQRYRFVNRTYEEWFGRPRAEVVGRTVREVLGEAAYDKARRHVEAALAGERVTFEGLMPFRDGGPRHVEARYEPHRASGGDGRVLGFYALITDASARVRAEEALREAERRQAFLLALGDRLRGLSDPEEVKAATSEALGRHVGAARAGYGEVDAAGEVVAVERDWTAGGDVASLAGEARLLDGFGRAIIDELRAGRTLRVEDCLTDPRSAGDGPAAVWASIGTRSLVVVPLVKAGRLTALLYLHEPAPRRWTDAEAALAEAVAERTWSAVVRARAEAALRDARARAEALAAEREAVLGQLAEGVIVTDPAGRIVFVNEAAARLHGVARLDVAPEDYSETYHLFTEDGRPYPPEELPLARAVLRGERVSDERWLIRRPDGTEVLAIGSARPLRAPDGAAIGAVLTLRDDTAREAAERAVRESEARLRSVVEDQTEFISRFTPDSGSRSSTGPTRRSSAARARSSSAPRCSTSWTRRSGSGSRRSCRLTPGSRSSPTRWTRSCRTGAGAGSTGPTGRCSTRRAGW
jgi:PAS domain S-box-containing protein